VPFLRFYVNSTIVTGLAMLGQTLTATMVAYGFARFRFPFKSFFFMLVLSTLMVPWEVTIVPSFLLFKWLGWLDTLWPLIVPHWFGGGPFFIFLLRQFFLTIPRELEDAARIDGAGTWRVFTRIVLPLSQPVLAALAIFAFRSAWNDFLWPLIAVNRPEMFPLPVALALLRGAYTSESYGPIMAGATLSALPLLLVFLVANRRIVEGVRVSGLKG